MALVQVDNAWVEYPVSGVKFDPKASSATGGVIDVERSVVTALRNLSFTLRDGDRLGLIGHNGAGKTTMLRLLSGVYAPTRGRVTTVGRISTLFNAAPGLVMEGTGRENIYICGLHLGMTRKEIARKIDDIIEFSDLGNYIDLPVRIYSAGMMTRLGFSIATSVEPDILVVDEGLATGDAQFARKARARMDELMKRTSILILASHSEALVSNMCTRCLLLEHGQIIADGPAGEVTSLYIDNVVEGARSGNPDALANVYRIVQDMASRSRLAPPELEELALRHALEIDPDNIQMLRRRVLLLERTGQMIPDELALKVAVGNLALFPDNSHYRAEVAMLYAAAKDAVQPELRSRAEMLLKQATDADLR